MIDISGLTKTFGPSVALTGVDLHVDSGERVMLVGPNGAGKTTLLRILATLSRPTSGTVQVAGLDIARAGAAVRSRIGFLSHDSLLYNDLTARQNLEFYARMYGVDNAGARIRELLEAVGLERRGDDLVRTFSRGMQQRLAVARAILHRPQLLLLDEPYTGLDSLAGEALTLLLGVLVEAGSTLLITTHHPVDEGLLARRAVVLRRGRIIEDAPVGDLVGFQSHYRSLLAGDIGPVGAVGAGL
ncbi:MAG: heme ABC exporter ATP-binding protein CcmA [Anaerolineae bacterium]